MLRALASFLLGLLGGYLASRAWLGDSLARG
jgi:hypothetical protein